MSGELLDHRQRHRQGSRVIMDPRLVAMRTGERSRRLRERSARTVPDRPQELSATRHNACLRPARQQLADQGEEPLGLQGLADDAHLLIMDEALDELRGVTAHEDRGQRATQAGPERCDHLHAGLVTEMIVRDLVCPASFGLGQHFDVTLLSVPEGDDKPQKYPIMFRAADLLLLTKADLLPVLPEFDPQRAEASLRAVGRGCR